jgi:hypothetical protein
MLDYSLLFLFSVLLGGGPVCPGIVPTGWVGVSQVVRDAHLFILPIHMQAGLKLVAVGRNGTNFSQCSVAWGGFPQAMGSGCHRV